MSRPQVATVFFQIDRCRDLLTMKSCPILEQAAGKLLNDAFVVYWSSWKDFNKDDRRESLRIGEKSMILPSFSSTIFHKYVLQQVASVQSPDYFPKT